MSTHHESTDNGRTKPPTLPSHATFLGRDGDGEDHWYSRYEHTVWIENDELDRHDLDPTPVETPGEWARHVRAMRGEWEVLLLGAFPQSEVDELAHGVKERLEHYREADDA